MRKDTPNYYALRFFSYSGHGTVDVIFFTMADAEKEYKRAIAVRDDWITDNAGVDVVPFIAFDVSGNDGMKFSFNLYNHELILLDLKKAAFENAKRASAVEKYDNEANAKYGRQTTGFAGGNISK